MRGTNRMRALIVSTSVILMCLVVVLGSTFALFTDSEKITNHLKAGDLQIKLERLRVHNTSVNDRGYLVANPWTNAYCDFSQATTENVFALDDTQDVIVPRSAYTSEMRITNLGDVACEYWVEVVLTDGTDPALAKQLQVEVKGGNTQTARLSAGISPFDAAGNQNYAALGIVEANNGTQTFEVTVTFLDDADGLTDPADSSLALDNDDVKTKDVSFDLIVHAVQYAVVQ